MSTPSLHELNRRETTRNLVRTALELFRERGFEKTTVEEIASRSGVSARTFFRYFEAKEAVVFVEREQRRERFAERIHELQATMPTFDAVQTACLEVAQDYQDNRDAVREEYDLVANSPALRSYELIIDQRWEENIADAFLASAEPPDRLSAMVYAGAVFGVIRAGIREWFFHDARDDLVELGRKAFSRIELKFEKG